MKKNRKNRPAAYRRFTARRESERQIRIAVSHERIRNDKVALVAEMKASLNRYAKNCADVPYRHSVMPTSAGATIQTKKEMDRVRYSIREFMID